MLQYVKMVVVSSLLPIITMQIVIKIAGTLLKYLMDIDAVLGIIQQKECLMKKQIHKLCKE